MKQLLRIGFLLFCALLAGCTAASLRRAQDAFNGAAAAEAAQRDAGMWGDGGLSLGVSALGQYRAALHEVDEQLQDHTEDLRGDQLLGTAYMLKALCLWRIADLADGEAASASAADPLDATLATIRNELDAERIVLGTRDRVLLDGLPGLRDHDRGLRATKLDGDAGAARYFDSAILTLDKALAAVAPPPQHPVRVYVHLAQLSSLRAWQSAAFGFLPQTDAAVYVAERITERAKSTIATLEPMTKGDSGLEARIRAFKAALGI